MKRMGERGRMSSDNLAGITGALGKKIFLFPGMIFQWFLYMSVAGQRYSVIRQNTRLARSQIMTWIFSIAFWCFLLLFIFSHFQQR
jgi:hypothetical protein